MPVLRRRDAAGRRRRMSPFGLPRNRNRRRRNPPTRVQKPRRRAPRRRRKTPKSHLQNPFNPDPPQSLSSRQPRNGIPPSLRFLSPQISQRPLQRKLRRFFPKQRRCTPPMLRTTPLPGFLPVLLLTASSCRRFCSLERYPIG